MYQPLRKESKIRVMDLLKDMVLFCLPNEDEDDADDDPD